MVQMTSHSRLNMTRGNKMSDLYSVLADWYPEGNFTEADLWEAIAESEGVDINEIMDRDLAEFI